MVRTWGRWTSVRDPHAYAFLVATNLARRAWKDRQRRAEVTAGLASGSRSMTMPVDPSMLDLIERLPPKLRDPVLLHYYADLPAERVARILHRPAGTIRQRSARGPPGSGSHVGGKLTMDERPFPPATPIHLGDEDQRLNATIRAIRRRRTTRAGAGAAVAVVAAAIAVPLLVPGSSPGTVNVAGDPPCGSAASAASATRASGSTSCPTPTTTVAAAAPPTTTGSTDVTATTVPPITPPATVPPATVPAPTAPTTVPPKTTTTNAGTPVTSGVVTDSSGRPVAGAYVIGLNNLAVARTNARGRYSMACVDQKLVAAAWLLPVMTTGPGGSGGFSYGVNTTKYSPPPGTPGPGYVFPGRLRRDRGDPGRMRHEAGELPPPRGRDRRYHLDQPVDPARNGRGPDHH